MDSEGIEWKNGEEERGGRTGGKEVTERSNGWCHKRKRKQSLPPERNQSLTRDPTTHTRMISHDATRVIDYDATDLPCESIGFGGFRKMGDIAIDFRLHT